LNIAQINKKQNPRKHINLIEEKTIIIEEQKKL